MSDATAQDKGYHVEFRAAAWYGDHPVVLDFPLDWEVRVFRPNTPPPLSDGQIAEALERPVGQPPLRILAAGKSLPLIIVDDLNRPTPVDRIMPFILRHFKEAGVSPAQVRILMATGTHGQPQPGAMAKKVGREAASSCQLLIHDHERNVVKVGKTSSGTPVLVNREVMRSDFVVGVGGVYPQHPHWFGGGTKLAIGILGKRTIAGLHFRHGAMTTVYAIETPFRSELDEVAHMIGFNTGISLHVDADRQPVRIVSGDHYLYYPDAARFAREVFSAPAPGESDVVVANAYPVDVSVTFSAFKGSTPLSAAAPHASRILITASPEGAGHHGLFPLLNIPRFHAQRQRIRRILMMRPMEVADKTARRVFARMASQPRPRPIGDPHRHRVLLYRSLLNGEGLAFKIPATTILRDWPEVIACVSREQGNRRGLKVAIYPCAPLQCLDVPASVGRDSQGEG